MLSLASVAIAARACAKSSIIIDNTDTYIASRLAGLTKARELGVSAAFAISHSTHLADSIYPTPIGSAEKYETDIVYDQLQFALAFSNKTKEIEYNILDIFNSIVKCKRDNINFKKIGGNYEKNNRVC